MSNVTPYYIDRAKESRPSCKRCKGNCRAGELRIAKIIKSGHGDWPAKSWYHVDCFMNGLLRQFTATKRVDSTDDIGNWENISLEDQEFILKKLNDTEKLYAEKNKGIYTAKVLKNESALKPAAVSGKSSESMTRVETDDNNFTTFMSITKKIAEVDAYTEKTVKHKDETQNSVHSKLSLMTPVLPMLAEACKSVEMAMKKCPEGMFSEIQYDGERVQVHKKNDEFKYFSRSLKPIIPYKFNHFKDYLPKAFPKGTDMILDAEVLMVDVNTGKPLPFGTLGVHKKSEFKDAQLCLYIFDCLYYNGQVLIDLPIRKRRQFLYDNMVEVKNHIMFSEQQLIEKPVDLAKMIAKVLQLGLEGLVLKDLESKYEPGKRHWLKVKKNHLFDGAMADTLDLLVLGAWFGTGHKGGMLSVFLMGCFDERRHKWVTVTKVNKGHDYSTLERLHEELSPLMVKISQDFSKVPAWLDCSEGVVPAFIASDPKKQPVWEITGKQLKKASLHTADGLTVRFPRVARIRSDKDWETATSLEELKHLYKTSKEKTDVSLLNKLAATASEADESPKKMNKRGPSRVGKIYSFFTKKGVTNGQSGTSSMNTSNSSDKSKNESSSDTNDETEEKSTKKDKKRKLKIEDFSDDSNGDVINEEMSEKPAKKNNKRKFKDDSPKANDNDSADVEDTPSKKEEKIKIKEEFNRRSSLEDRDEKTSSHRQEVVEISKKHQVKIKRENSNSN